MKVTLIQNTEQYSGFMSLESRQLSVERFDGSEMQITREVVLRGNAAAVLIHDPAIDRFLLVKQFRPGAMASENPWLIELVAGMVEPDELDHEVVQREAEEEANVTLKRVVPMCRYWSSPGGSTERIALFYAEADLADAGGVYGLADEGEDIQTVLMSEAELVRAMNSGELDNAMTLMGVLWFLVHRADLLAAGRLTSK